MLWHRTFHCRITSLIVASLPIQEGLGHDAWTLISHQTQEQDQAWGNLGMQVDGRDYGMKTKDERRDSTWHVFQSARSGAPARAASTSLPKLTGNFPPVIDKTIRDPSGRRARKYQPLPTTCRTAARPASPCSSPKASSA